MDIRTAVNEELDKAVEAGERLPSLRVLRARIGRGSLTTISDAVKAWETERKACRNELPGTMPTGLRDELAGAAWKVLLSYLRSEIDAAVAAERAKNTAEIDAAASLRDEAEGMLAETRVKADEFERLKKRTQEQEIRILKLSAALTAAEKDVQALNKRLTNARKERDAALDEARTLRAENDAINRLIPFLDKKLLHHGS